MKARMITALVCALISVTSLAQSDVTTFLGIPVDGTVSEMVRKLEAKGFKRHHDTGESVVLSGTFNGAKSNIHVLNNDGAVYGIGVAEKDRTNSVTSAKNRYNRILSQFKNKDSYTDFGVEFIPEGEDIQYEMIVHDKQYTATFYQEPKLPKKEDLTIEYLEESDNYVAQMYRYFRKKGWIPEDAIEEDSLDEIAEKFLEITQADNRSKDDMEIMELTVDEFRKRPVIVQLNREYSSYYITYVYANLRNNNHDDDL